MTLNDLLKVVDEDTRIQIQIELFGSTFRTSKYKNYLLNDEEAAGLLTKEVENVWCIEDEGISTLVVNLK